MLDSFATSAAYIIKSIKSVNEPDLFHERFIRYANARGIVPENAGRRNLPKSIRRAA